MVIRALFTAIIATLSASAVAADGVQVEHADLQITLPDQPARDVTTIGGQDGSEPTRQHRLILNKPNGSIIIWYQDAFGISDPESALQAARDSIVRSAGGEVREEETLTRQDHPGRYFIVSIPAKNGEFRVAYFFAAGRFYQIMAVGTKEFTRSESTNKMFESAQFINRPCR